jgi:nucleoside-diphosphate-sugar epimerase
VALSDPGRQVTFLGDNREGDPFRWVADIDALAALGYRPSWTLERGLADYIAWLGER